MRTIFCRTCQRDLFIDAFRSSRVGPGTKRDQCMKCGAFEAHKWNLAHPDRVKKSRAAHYPKAYLTRVAWLQKNPGYNNQYMEKWRNNNRAVVNATAANSRVINKARIALRGSRMAPWANETAIKAIYLEARRRSLETGIMHHVDHIIPLKGKNVCGLHVENNLQILTGMANRQKYNSTEEIFRY